jgi:hypothetical protein
MTEIRQQSFFDEPAPELNTHDDKVCLLALAEIPGVVFITAPATYKAPNPSIIKMYWWRLGSIVAATSRNGQE